MTTIFDEKVEKAKELLIQSKKLLQEATTEGTDGLNEISSNYVDEILLIIVELNKINRRLE